MDAYVVQELIKQCVVDFLLVMLVFLASAAKTAIQKWSAKMRSQTDFIEDRKARGIFVAAIDDVERLATKAVGEIEQTTAKALREAVKDGKVDKRELEVLAKRAFDEVDVALRPECKKLIADNYGSFSKYLTKVIESKVLEVKSLSS